MRYHPNLDHRRSTRLPTWDYRDTGAYFATICTHDRTPLFGRFAGDGLALSRFGEIAEDVWRRVIGPPQSPGEFVVMPNHVHGIIWIQREPTVEPAPSVGAEQLSRLQTAIPWCRVRGLIAGTTVAQPLRPEFASIRRGLRDGLEPGSLFVIVRTFKSAVSKRINNLRHTPGAPIWQDDYHERILRDRQLDRAREYILDNPRKWAEDKHNPAVYRKQA